MYKNMTPGPTTVAKEVRLARSEETTNPDIDPAFFEEYKDTCTRLNNILSATGDAYILGGEGILALEAACATLTEHGDKVLVIDNGIFGEGFKDFVTIYGGTPVLYTADYHLPIDVIALESFLRKEHDFKYATVVHCDTPSGVRNPIEQICPLLKRFGIPTVVDAVASTFGETIKVDEWEIDILCGGSQKVLSAPPGLAFVTVSEDAQAMMKKRKSPVASFYCNLSIFQGYYEKQWFPYTMPISDIKGFAQALKQVEEDGSIVLRHRIIGSGVRRAVKEAGLSLYLLGGYANTVTAIRVPENVEVDQILKRMREQHNILIGGCFGVLAGKVFRIGHMGNNARMDEVAETLEALQEVLTYLEVPLLADMSKVFRACVED